MPRIDPSALRALLDADSERGWRVFIDDYTPALVGLIERAAVTDADEVMDVYVRVCERLADRNCMRLRRYDPARGDFIAWLSVVVRRTVVDWVRSRAGRRRAFRALTDLAPFERRVFEGYYWEGLRPAEIAAACAASDRRDVDIGEVLEALERIHRRLDARQFAELAAGAARRAAPVSLDADDPMTGMLDVASAAPDPETLAQHHEIDTRFERALASLNPEDAAIVRLRYVEGLSRDRIRRALRLTTLTEDYVSGILRRLRAALKDVHVSGGEPSAGALRFFEQQ